MKRFLTMLSLVILGFASTSCYDDSALWDSVNDLDSRVKTLETLCTEMNENLTSLQALVNAMKLGDYIVDVTPLTENGVEVGYTITFAERGTVNIYHGKDGISSGDAPEFGVKQDTDGVYYWTVNGQWVLDDKGNKLPASSVSGESGVTPQLKIENEKWYVSYDEGETWEEVGSAAGSCLFKDVKLTDEKLTITLTDGTVLSLPIGERFRIVLGDFDINTLKYGQDVEIPYTIEGAAEEVTMFAVSNHWMFEVEIIEETSTSGRLVIVQEDYLDREVNAKVAIFAAGESGMTVSKVIKVTSGTLYISEGEYWYDITAEAAQISVTVASNFDYEVSADVDWVTLAETKTLEEKTLTFDIAENTEYSERYAEICIGKGEQYVYLYIRQQGRATEINLEFSVEEFAGYCFAEVDLTSLADEWGRTIIDVLEYGSWEELRYDIGNREEMMQMMPVSILGFDPYTYNILECQYSANGAGYWLDADGRPSFWAEENARCAWEIYPYDWNEDDLLNFKMYLHVMPGYITLGDVYNFGVSFIRHQTQAQFRINVTIKVEEYKDPEIGLYPETATPGEFDINVEGTLDLAALDYYAGVSFTEPFEEVKNLLGLTTYQLNEAINQGAVLIEGILPDGTSFGGGYVYLNADNQMTSWDDADVAVAVEWRWGPKVGDFIVYSFPMPSRDDELGIYWGDSVLNAVGKTFKVTYRLYYESTIINMNCSIKVVNEVVLWEDRYELLSDWSTSLQIHNMPVLESGMSIYVEYEAAGYDYYQLKFCYIDAEWGWNAMTSPVDVNEYGCVMLDAEQTEYVLALNDDDIAAINAGKGMVIQGYGAVITKVSYR